MSIERFGQLIEHFGWPGAMLLVIVASGWLVGRRFVAWGEPLAREFISAHTSLAQKLEANLDEQTEGHTKTHGKLDRIHEDVKEIKTRVKP